MVTALRNKEFETAAQIQGLRDELDVKNSRTADEVESLKTNMQRMLEDKDRHHAQELQMLGQQREEQVAVVQAQQQDLMVMERKLRDIKFDIERQVLAQRNTMDQFMRVQTVRAETESELRKRETDLRESLDQERALQEMRIDDERKIQIQMQREYEDRAQELREKYATMSILRVIVGVGLAAVGAFSQNPVLGAAGLKVMEYGMSSR